MSENKSETGKNFLVQGSILAIAGVITKIIGAVYPNSPRKYTG